MPLNKVTITGTFDDGSGTALSGTAVFTPSQTVYWNGQPVVQASNPVSAAITGGVLQSVSLVATDNTPVSFVSQTGFWFWTVAITLNGVNQGSFSFFLPHTPSTADLYSLANTAAGGGGATLPLTTLGDILYENATPAAARLAGNTSSTKNFLTQTGTGTVSAAPAWGTIAAADVPGFDGVTVTGTPSAGQYPRASSGSAAAWGAIQAADVPQLAQYNPSGLTGATAATSYAGGTTGGHPLTGTWSAGQWVVDESSQVPQIWVCVTGGTPGTWRRVGKNPEQFFISDYAKCDVKQALVSVTSGSAVINTTPLGAPAAPVPTTSASGGTIAAGVYQCVVTFVNKWGETTGSTSGPVTTTGSTSTITIPSPTPTGNSTGWYAYVSQAGGAAGTATRQQAPGSPTAMGVSLTLTAPPTNTGAVAPASDTSAAQVFTSTAVDGGKNVMINGGLGTPGGPYIGTISTVQSATQATLSDTGIAATQAGCAMVFSSDDRLNVDQCISDAKAYALANNNFCQVILGDKMVGLGTGLFQSTVNTAGSNPTGVQYNTQVRIPVGNMSGQTEKLEFQLLGSADNAHAGFWVSQLPNLVGGTFVSYTLGPSSADPNYGQQSVISGPVGATFNGSNSFANVKPVIDGIQVVMPGWNNAIGIDLIGTAGYRLRGSIQAYAPTVGGVNPQNNWTGQTTWQNKIGTGFRPPTSSNNDDCLAPSLTIEGITTAITSSADHLIFERLCTVNIYFGIKIVAPLNADTHDITILQWSCENLTGGGIQVGGAAHVKVHIVFDGESASPVYDIQDNGNTLYGNMWWSDPFRANGPNGFQIPVIQGCANLNICNGQLVRQVYTAPSYTLGTTFVNPWYHPVTLTLAGGTVTGISIGPHGGSLTSLGITSGTFRLPANWDINIAGSVKPTTFIAVPD